MKTARLFTLLGSFLLIASAAIHAAGYPRLLRAIAAGAISPRLEGLLKASWWVFAVEFLALGVIVLLARAMERGRAIILLCAATTGVTAGLFLFFLGLFVGVYLLAAVTLLLLIGGALHEKQST